MSPGSTATILNVDDDESARYALTRTLTHAGYTVWEAASGEEALQRAGECPDLILLDVRLPGVDGYEVCRRLKQNPLTRSILVLQRSAHFRRTEHRVRGLEEGADGYVVDSGDPAELLAHVNALLRLRDTEQERRAQETHFRAVARHLPAILWTTDPQLRITSTMGAGLAMLGLQSDQFVGRALYELFTTVEEAMPTVRAHREALNGRSVSYEQRWRGRRFQVHLRPFMGSEGGVRGAIGVAVEQVVPFDPSDEQPRDMADENLAFGPREGTPFVLVVDAERPARRKLQEELAAEGYMVSLAGSGEEALRLVDRTPPDLVILNVGFGGEAGLTGGSDVRGLETCRQIRSRSGCPIVAVGGRAAERDLVAALDHGADDYLVKPFGMDELRARVRAHLRRWRGLPLPDEPFAVGELRIDPRLREVTLRGLPLRLTPTEYELLLLLVRNAGRVLTHELILQHLRGAAYEADIQALRVHVANLRKKIEREPSRPRLLLTELGVGYRFVSPASSAPENR